jgi:hypothetical protein
MTALGRELNEVEASLQVGLNKRHSGTVYVFDMTVPKVNLRLMYYCAAANYCLCKLFIIATNTESGKVSK